uniref:TRAF-type domain-containing protein n=1 Tax=Syphacia muris TaxID=451379 RepID=A0A0N5AV94_9BILA
MFEVSVNNMALSNSRKTSTADNKQNNHRNPQRRPKGLLIVAKSFTSRFITPFDSSKTHKTDSGKAEIVWNILNRFTIPSREIGLIEQSICRFAQSCLTHNDQKVRSIGKSIFVLIYSCSSDKNYIKQQLSMCPSLRTERNLIMQQLQKKFFAIDEASTKQENTKKFYFHGTTANRSSLQHVPKLDELKRPKTITLTEDSNKGATDNESVDYDKICMFCGQFNEHFTPEGLNEHFLNSCFMLKKCDYCKEILEISTLNNHYLEKCTAKDQFKKCYRCKLAIPKKKHLRHITLNQCKVVHRNGERCFLCHKEVYPNNDIGWRKHLMGNWSINSSA